VVFALKNAKKQGVNSGIANDFTLQRILENENAGEGQMAE